MIMSWPYIAGFLDGEGCIQMNRTTQASGISKGRGTLQCTMVQAENRGKEVLVAMQAFLAEYDICSSIQTRRAGQYEAGTKECHTIYISGWIGGVKFLEHVYPYMWVKRHIAMDVIRFNKIYPRIASSARGLMSWETRRKRMAAQMATNA